MNTFSLEVAESLKHVSNYCLEILKEESALGVKAWQVSFVYFENINDEWFESELINFPEETFHDLYFRNFPEYNLNLKSLANHIPNVTIAQKTAFIPREIKLVCEAIQSCVLKQVIKKIESIRLAQINVTAYFNKPLSLEHPLHKRTWTQDFRKYCAAPHCSKWKITVLNQNDQKNTLVKMKKCSICLSTFYCSADCQKKDWKAHKLECVAPSK